MMTEPQETYHAERIRLERQTVCVSPFGAATHATAEKTAISTKPITMLHLLSRSQYVMVVRRMEHTRSPWLWDGRA